MSKSIQDRSAAQAEEHYPALGMIYDQITGDEDARVCKDIPEAA